jgi:transcriptional regulator with XRE-family HTH domain
MPRRTQDIDAAVGLRMAARRSALGLSQTALAVELGVSFQQVQKYEKGANRVSASRLHQVATVLGCSVADFFPARANDVDALRRSGKVSTSRLAPDPTRIGGALASA